MSQKILALIVKQKYAPPGRDPYWCAELTLLNEAGEELVRSPRRLEEFTAVADLLARDAGVSFDELQKAKVTYEAGKQARVHLNLEADQIEKLGFGELQRGEQL
jgi:hypothetical protein